MGYELHIERADGSPISLDEWSAAIAATEGLRLRAAEDFFARNPRTGDEIRIASEPGDTDVYLPDEDRWVPWMRYSPIRISFKPPLDFDGAESPLRRTLIQLASALKSRLVGDGGEVYT